MRNNILTLITVLLLSLAGTEVSASGVPRNAESKTGYAPIHRVSVSNPERQAADTAKRLAKRIRKDSQGHEPQPIRTRLSRFPPIPVVTSTKESLRGTLKSSG